MSVVARAVGFPALLVAALAVALAPSVSAALGAVPLALGVVAYAIAFGVVLGALSRWASLLSVRHGRTTFAALVLLPVVAGDALGDVPSVVSGFAWLADRVAALGGAVG